jgi:molybdopterin-containing oxidoreductase family iron-sulfur binding subunit
MEKCTYCTQRIQAARVAADKDGRDIREGEVVTACQQACPTTAIVFGNLNDPGSAVAKRRRSGRHFVLLEELGTRPRTTYLARWNDAPKKDSS